MIIVIQIFKAIFKHLKAPSLARRPPRTRASAARRGTCAPAERRGVTIHAPHDNNNDSKKKKNKNDQNKYDRPFDRRSCLTRGPTPRCPTPGTDNNNNNNTDNNDNNNTDNNNNPSSSPRPTRGPTRWCPTCRA